VSTADRPSSHPSFWDERYADHEALFGTRPSAFVVREADRIPEGSSVLEMGAGEGRTLLWLARERDAVCTAVDFSETALHTARQRAQAEGLPLDTVAADVRRWTPARRWDVVVVTFLQLRPDERAQLYRTIRAALREGGLVLGEWFRPAHLTDDFDRLGPSRPDRMVPPAELRAAFAADEVQACRADDVTLADGPHLWGRAAVVRFVARRAVR
jgi:SAM-dependent methyltransferase